MDFFSTRAGMVFQERLLKSLEKIAKELERSNNFKEKELELNNKEKEEESH